MVVITFFVSQTNENNHTCVFWNSSEGGGTWSDSGCSVLESNYEYTVCSCNHLSSFAVLMALYEMEVKTTRWYTWFRHESRNSSLFLFPATSPSSLSLCPQQDKFELQLITWIGLSLSLICLFICILTFSLIRSIQSPRTSIHLHLCISLFIAVLIFLAGISRTESKVNTIVQ